MAIIGLFALILIELIVIVIIQMNKLTQEEIDMLANESDEQGKKPQKKDVKDEVEQNYEQEYQNQLNEEIIDQQSRYKNGDQDHNLHNMEQVASEIQEENGDFVAQENISRLGSESKFKNDEDLSLAKSQFIESAQISKNDKQNKPNTLLPEVKVQKAKQTKKEQTKVQKKDLKKQNKPEKKVIQKKVPIVEKEQKKEKLSESEINRRMKEIKESKEQLLRKKQQKQKKLQQIRRKEYQEAKKQQEEKKQRNKKILQQQRLKRKNDSNIQPKKQKNNESQIKIPQKRTDFQYMDMKKQRKKEQKKIQKQIEQDNKAKLKKLLEKPQSDLKGEAKKAAIIEQRKIMKERQQKIKLMESKEEDILIIKQIKQEINEAKKFNLQKTEQINRAEKAVADLMKKVKQKQNQYFKLYNTKISQANEQFQQNDFSQATPIQKFVACFPEAKNSDDIFKLIDSNGDGVLSSEEIKEKLIDINLEEDIIRKVEELLDENSDGTVSNEQFVFKIEMELKKQKDFKEILGNIQIADPLQLQAKILDMQAKIKFINAKLQTHQKKVSSSQNRQKIEKLEEKLKKVENKWKKQTEGTKEENKKIDISSNTMGVLVNELIKLKNEKKIKQAFIEKLRVKVKENIQQKNKLLTSRVQENLRLEQQIYKIQNQIQEDQLRYLSLKKIKENKKGYQERQSKYQKQRQEAYKRTKQYQISITDPGKQAQIVAQKDEMRLLAAVLMIQRNYRRRKARGELQKLKQAK